MQHLGREAKAAAGAAIRAACEAKGWGPSRMARELGIAEGRGPQGLGRQAVRRWMTGGQAPVYWRPWIEKLLHLNLAPYLDAPGPATVVEDCAGEATADVCAAPPGAPPDLGDATNRRDALKTAALAAAATAADITSPTAALAYTRRLESTAIGSGTLDHLEGQLERLTARYAATPAREAWRIAGGVRAEVAQLMEGRHTLVQGRELARLAGMLSVVLGWLAHDMGAATAAEAWCRDGYAHGLQAEVPEVCAWADDARATICLYDDRPGQALAAAERGAAHAPAGSRAAARLAGQLSRTSAAAGRPDAFAAAHRTALRHVEQLPAHGAGLFGADAVRLRSFDASSYLALDQPGRALKAAEDAICQYRSVPYHQQSPTRMAIAQLDAAEAHAALGQIDAALALGKDALGCQRMVAAITSRTARLLHRLHPHRHRHPQIQEFARTTATLLPAP
ncbi:XRE family transcriptional regulator [Streptomyces sp. 8N114]|uniref:XRE family transcriptional regulator n=1 Tax=Streptomyces sp. 8N114 TaxID=3457419 RepID=UPI003FD66723